MSTMTSIKVTELASLIEDQVNNIGLNYFWVEGEIQNYRGSSKHHYFTLNEDTCGVKAIIWESTFSKLGIRLDNGLKGLFYGKLNYYTNKNELSFVIYKVKLDKEVGNIYAKLEHNKQICAAAGYFDKNNSADIDEINNIGIITRYNSAAYNDLVSSIDKCYGIKSYVYDSGMQGVKSLDEIINGIVLMNKLAKKLKLDCIIITRGGGSKEDLWVFNEIELIKAVFNSVVPIITGIGHEIDVSLVDLTADKYCITPTAIGSFIGEHKSLGSKLEELEYTKECVNAKLKTLYNRHSDNVNSVISDIDVDKVLSALDRKIINLDKYRGLVENKLKDHYLNRLSALNYIKSDLDNIINNLLNIKLTKNSTIVLKSSDIVKGDIYNLVFNGETFKIKVL